MLGTRTTVTQMIEPDTTLGQPVPGSLGTVFYRPESDLDMLLLFS
jgi:hypothetical protein